MNKDIRAIVEEALKQLNLKYRSVKYKNGLIYFITTWNGSIFNLSIEEGKIRFWKFVNPNVLKSQTRNLFESSKTSSNAIFSGIHITADGEAEVYIEDKMSFNNPESKKILEKQIKFFAQLVSRLALIC